MEIGLITHNGNLLKYVSVRLFIECCVTNFLTASVKISSRVIIVKLLHFLHYQDLKLRCKFLKNSHLNYATKFYIVSGEHASPNWKKMSPHSLVQKKNECPHDNTRETYITYTNNLHSYLHLCTCIIFCLLYPRYNIYGRSRSAALHNRFYSVPYNEYARKELTPRRRPIKWFFLTLKISQYTYKTLKITFVSIILCK